MTIERKTIISITEAKNTYNRLLNLGFYFVRYHSYGRNEHANRVGINLSLLSEKIININVF